MCFVFDVKRHFDSKYEIYMGQVIYYGVQGIIMFQDDLRLDHPEVFLDLIVGNSQVELMNVSL